MRRRNPRDRRGLVRRDGLVELQRDLARIRRQGFALNKDAPNVASWPYVADDLAHPPGT